jgi:hypothetical protein
MFKKLTHIYYNSNACFTIMDLTYAILALSQREKEYKKEMTSKSEHKTMF